MGDGRVRRKAAGHERAGLCRAGDGGHPTWWPARLDRQSNLFPLREGDCMDSAMKEPHNRVVQVGRFGGPDALQVVDAPLPAAGHGEVRVRVLASGLEYTDILIRRHLYPQTMRHRPPFVMGTTSSGR